MTIEKRIFLREEGTWEAVVFHGGHRISTLWNAGWTLHLRPYTQEERFVMELWGEPE